MLKLNLSPGDITDSAVKWLEKIQESVSGAPRIYIDNTISIIKSDSENFMQTLTDTTKTSSLVPGYSV